MVRVLAEKLPNYAALKHENFTQHLNALRSLGATGRLFQIADQVNKIRNSMAHVKRGLKTKINEKDIRELCSQASGVFGGAKDVLSFNFTYDGVTQELRKHSLAHQLFAIAIMAAAGIDTIPEREQYAVATQEVE